MKDTVLPFNTLDNSILEPGDILLVANPTDMPLIRYLIFWSHVGLVSTRGGVVDAVREPRGEATDEQAWFQVQHAPLLSYQLAYDILALRPRLPAAERRAAALYAESQIGLPYAPNLWRILFGRRDTTVCSCASLVWQAYKKQGLDLAPVPAWCSLNVLPLWLARDPQVEIIGRGTRYATIPAHMRRLRVQRWWFRRVVGGGVGLYLAYPPSPYPICPSR
jgi:uncharacterized protein YycO